MKSETFLKYETHTDIIISDPAYFIPGDLWAPSGYGENLPFPHVTVNTGIGDGCFDVIDDSYDDIGTYECSKETPQHIAYQ